MNKQEFIDVYKKALDLAKERFRKKRASDYPELLDIDEVGISFKSDIICRGHVVGREDVTISWEELEPHETSQDIESEVAEIMKEGEVRMVERMDERN